MINLLFLHPTPGLGRQASYSKACQNLSAEGIQSHFVYNGEELPIECESSYHFNSWVERNRGLIDRTNIQELESRYPDSNLRLAIVAERRIANYSLLEGSYPSIEYDEVELLFLLKAGVLFYEFVLEDAGITHVLAHHTDNFHSALLFEMSLSLGYECFLLFPDYYWNRTVQYCFDNKYFLSSRLRSRYEELLSDPVFQSRLLEPDVDAYIQSRIQNDASTVQPSVLPRLGLMANVLNAFQTLRRRDLRFHWLRGNIVDDYGQIHLPSSIRAFLKRNLNLIGARLFVTYDSVPDSGFVYFPLQRVPEAAMLSRAVGYLNQTSLVEVLSASLPAGTTLVVKDHPRGPGIHSAGFYNTLTRLPNVVLVAPETSNEYLQSRCDLLVTVAGTLGFQQLLSGRPILMLGRKYYEILEGIIHVTDLNSLPYILKKTLAKEYSFDDATMARSLRAFVSAMIDTGFETGVDLKDIHHDPEKLASLLLRIFSEVYKHSQVERDY
ncbi:MAG: hypothetical protein JJ921_09590 [Pseudomonadales bacterium]|nr:hypothetical protein [Pseudomonadales bacterium]MBO7004801.1 hypothetical protein [Pseudomonadales bacterium]